MFSNVYTYRCFEPVQQPLILKWFFY